MNVRAEVDKNDVMMLQRLFSDVEKYTKRDVNEMIKRTMRYALQSARNATKPRSKSVDPNGNRRGGNSVAKKHMFRPLETMPSSMGYWYTPKGENKPFKINKNLTKTELTRKGLVRVTKGIKKFTKGKGWTHIPWAGKKDHKDKRFKIPYAGLAKDGWRRSLGAFGNNDPGSDYNRSVRNINYARSADLLAEAVNKVKYVSKSSPASARYGLNRARKRIIGQEMPKIERAIERRFNR